MRRAVVHIADEPLTRPQVLVRHAPRRLKTHGSPGGDLAGSSLIGRLDLGLALRCEIAMRLRVPLLEGPGLCFDEPQDLPVV